jgi:tetratricopeptide (TPR) repeat protein
MSNQQRQESGTVAWTRRRSRRRWPAWLGLALAMAGVLLAATDAASAADVYSGAALMKQGNYGAVVTTETAALDTELSQRDAAVALYFRGLANRKLGRSSQAIADLGAAIWLGLPTTQRIVAQVQRGYIYQGLGLNEQAQHEISLAKTAAPSETASLLRQGDVIGDVALGTSGSSYGGSWWDRMTGGIGSSTPAPSTATASATPRASGSSGTATDSGWSITVDQADAAVADERATARSAAKESAPSAPASASASAPAPLQPTETASEAPAPSETASSGNGSGFSRWIGSWTGGSSQSAPAPAEAPAASGWSTETHAGQ